MKLDIQKLINIAPLKNRSWHPVPYLEEIRHVLLSIPHTNMFVFSFFRNLDPKQKECINQSHQHQMQKHLLHLTHKLPTLSAALWILFHNAWTLGCLECQPMRNSSKLIHSNLVNTEILDRWYEGFCRKRYLNRAIQAFCSGLIKSPLPFRRNVSSL